MRTVYVLYAGPSGCTGMIGIYESLSKARRGAKEYDRSMDDLEACEYLEEFFITAVPLNRIPDPTKQLKTYSVPGHES